MIRKFKDADMDTVLSIWLTASIKAHDFIEKAYWESQVENMRNVYLPASETYVYEFENEVAGFISLSENTIAAIFVSPDMQGKGIGKKLIAKAKELRKELQLTVYKENSPTIEFYKICGFKIIKEQVDKHTGHPELLMRFSL